MSTSESQRSAGRREVAYRVFATEFDDATLTVSENDDDRAPNYVVLPTGARVNRVFVVGVLTEVDAVSNDVVRGRIVDPTGAFIVYAGQYQPDAKTFLEGVSVPAFVAVTGKARTYQPDDSTQIYSSIRPETITEVDARTRDRWTLQAAEHTLNRIETIRPVLDRPEHGDALHDALVDEDVDVTLATGIPIALEHYSVTPEYLDALETLAVETVEVVAGDRDDVSPLTIDPTADREPEARDSTIQPTETTERTDSTDRSSTDPESTQAPTDDVTTHQPESEAADSQASDEPVAEDFDTDEMYEFDDDERAEIEDEYGTEFTTGSNVEETPTAHPENESDKPARPTDDDTSTDEPAGTEPDDDSPNQADDAEQPSAADLEDTVISVMRELDDGEGTPRHTLIETIDDRTAASPADIEDAIQDALMDGKCYEPTDDTLKAI